MGQNKSTAPMPEGPGTGALRWFDSRERNALLALLAAAVLLILCSLAGGMTSTTAMAEEPSPPTGLVIHAP